MKKKAVSKRLNSPLIPIKFDQTEMLLALFVVITLLVFLSWQKGFITTEISQTVLGVSTSR